MHIRVRRDFGEAPVIYELPDTLDGQPWERQSVSVALAYIQHRIDPTLSYALSCGRGTCNICVVRIAGEVVTACTTPVVHGMLVEPARQILQMKDMIVDMGLVKKARIQLVDAVSEETISQPDAHR